MTKAWVITIRPKKQVLDKCLSDATAMVKKDMEATIVQIRTRYPEMTTKWSENEHFRR